MKNLQMLFFVGLLALVACTGDKETEERGVRFVPKEPVPYSGGPTVSRLVLKYNQGVLSLADVRAARGSIIQPRIKENLRAIQAGEILVFEYRAFTASMTAIAAGIFFMPLKAEVEYMDPTKPHRILRGEEKLISSVSTLKIPFSSQLAVVQFFRLTPTDSDSISAWKRSPAGRIRIPQKKEGKQ